MLIHSFFKDAFVKGTRRSDVKGASRTCWQCLVLSPDGLINLVSTLTFIIVSLMLQAPSNAGDVAELLELCRNSTF